MLPKTRLGKRSPLGALLCPTTEPRTDQETSIAMGTAGVIHFAGRVKGHPGLKCESTCLMDKLDLTSGQGSLWIPSTPPVSSRSASSYIDVPGRQTSPDEVDMDQMMAAMVLSSLSCSPLLQSPAQPDPPAPLVDCAGSELSDSGSSGYWSVGHCNQSPAPSPPRAEPDACPTSPPEEGLDMELEQVLFDEPAPRRRRNSGKVAFRCLWPNCEKVLISVVGIKRHIRTTHLSRGGEHERCSRSEEDFYYTEVKQRDQQPPSPPLPSSPTFPPSPHPLSCSAPPTGSFWQVQSEHSYQAPPPSHLEAHCHSVALPTTCHRQMFRVRSVSVGEQWLQNHSAPCRRIRGDAKKCRKVYGIEQRDQWCTACRWKKACQRFLD